MHEYSIVEQLVENLRADMESQGVTRVRQIRLRRGSTFAEAPLRQAFEMLTKETPLAETELIVEEYSVRHTCPGCGHTQVVTADDLVGHLFVCPECGVSKEIDEAHGLELKDVVF